MKSYDRKLSASIAKERARLRDNSVNWYAQRERKRGKKRKAEQMAEPPRICMSCASRISTVNCVGCPFFKTADGAEIIFK